MTNAASPPPPAIPGNVWRFEALLYLSLAIDALSMPFRDDAFNDLSEMSAPVAKLATAGIILLFVYFVWLAAHRRKKWALWVLAVSLAMSVTSLFQLVQVSGWQGTSLIDLVSALLTGLGLYFAFTGDARNWFGHPGSKP